MPNISCEDVQALEKEIDTMESNHRQLQHQIDARKSDLRQLLLALKTCKAIYPNEYKNHTKPVIFPNLPREISLRIHILRNDLLELPIPFLQCIILLGYDQEESKNQLLDKIISSGGQNGFSVHEIEQFRSDKQVASVLCFMNPVYYRTLSEEQRDDWDITLVACRRDGTCIFDASNRLQRNPDVIRAACVESKRTVSIFRTQVQQTYGRDHPLAIFIEENMRNAE